MSKYEKSIILGLDGDRLKATMVARPERGAFPIYIKTYYLTTGRVQHMMRLLPDWLYANIDKLDRADPDEQYRLRLVINDLLQSIELVARIGEAHYGLPVSEEAKASIDLLQVFQWLSVLTAIEEQMSDESLRKHQHQGKKSQAFIQSLF